MHPSVVIADGIGEYVAAAVAGVFSLEDALKLVTNRTKADSINYSLPRIEIISGISGKLIQKLQILNIGAKRFCDR